MSLHALEEVKPDAESKTVIRVLGIGGAGCNAVDHMIREGVGGVDFVAVNTDAQALERSCATRKIQLGHSGLGAGSKPEAGREAAYESRDAIAAALEGAHMVFLTAGMGGGTGTGATPVIAEIAKQMGILTVAVVTKPFEFENRDRVAESGIEELTRHVDSLIVVLNDRLLEVYGEDATFEECFKAADNVLKNAVAGIAEIINVPGIVNVDFQDVRTAMAEMGRAMMGSAEASGPERARIAAEQAAVSPLLEGTELSGARCVLINFTASRASLKMSEVRSAVHAIRGFAAPEAFVKYGAVFDDSMEDRLRVTIVATGLGVGRRPTASSEVAGESATAVRQGWGTTPIQPAPLRSARVNGRNVLRALSEGLGRGNERSPTIPHYLRRSDD
ncbi:MAG: cell division protein FtsZ [Hydrogenophilus sp.]|nr:cell division protein FtsZ [Hydrogenophilus sp.]